MTNLIFAFHNFAHTLKKRLSILSPSYLEGSFNLGLDPTMEICHVYYLYQQMPYVYIYIYIYIYIINTPTCFDAPASSSESFILLIRFTNSIKSV